MRISAPYRYRNRPRRVLSWWEVTHANPVLLQNRRRERYMVLGGTHPLPPRNRPRRIPSWWEIHTLTQLPRNRRRKRVLVVGRYTAIAAPKSAKKGTSVVEGTHPILPSAARLPESAKRGTNLPSAAVPVSRIRSFLAVVWCRCTSRGSIAIDRKLFGVNRSIW